VTSSSLTRTGIGTITYGSVEDLQLTGTAYADTFRVTGTLAATPLTINAGAGDDQFVASGPNPCLAHLEDPLRLYTDGDLYLNWGGKNDKWLRNASAWYFLLPDGSLYLWDGSSQATGTLVAQVGTAVYADPSLLYDALAAGPDLRDIQGSLL